MTKVGHSFKADTSRFSVRRIGTWARFVRYIQRRGPGATPHDWPPGQSKDLSFSFKTASAGDFDPPLNHSLILVGVTS
jgi:hypothetical protein